MPEEAIKSEFTEILMKRGAVRAKLFEEMIMEAPEAARGGAADSGSTQQSRQSEWGCAQEAVRGAHQAVGGEAAGGAFQGTAALKLAAPS
mmetsp:Transcript_58761/g.124775  ORF Transcript_58761/g.124775 Transcript_58761/m.124775 type:complete len:90 (-) Transcript_58761:173-442(-)